MTTPGRAAILPFLLLLGACALSRGAAVNASAEAGAPSGDYVEARTATVFAGACHYASEEALLGREAVMAWRVREGSFEGVSLAGVEAVAVVAAERNLQHGDAPRSSVVFVGEGASPAQRAAFVRWLDANDRGALGRVVSVKAAPVSVAREGDRFRVRAGDAVELAGAALANRACCTMPSQIWYAPLSPMRERVVGCADVFRQSDPDLARDFVYPADNCAFVGTF